MKNRYFMFVYLMNGKSNFFYKKSGEYIWNHMELFQEIYGVKLTSIGSSQNEHPLAYVANSEGHIKSQGGIFTLNNEGIYKNDTGATLAIMDAGANTKGCFEKAYDNFFFTCTNTSDFACGYYD